MTMVMPCLLIIIISGYWVNFELIILSFGKGYVRVTDNVLTLDEIKWYTLLTYMNPPTE